MSAMKPRPDCPVDHEGDASMIACLTAKVQEQADALAELRAALAVPVRLTQITDWCPTRLVALDTEGRAWHGQWQWVTDTPTTHVWRFCWTPLPAPQHPQHGASHADPR